MSCHFIVQLHACMNELKSTLIWLSSRYKPEENASFAYGSIFIHQKITQTRPLTKRSLIRISNSFSLLFYIISSTNRRYYQTTRKNNYLPTFIHVAFTPTAIVTSKPPLDGNPLETKSRPLPMPTMTEQEAPSPWISTEAVWPSRLTTITEVRDMYASLI